MLVPEMFIRRDDYERMRDEVIEQRVRVVVLAEQAATHKTQTAFLIARINQLEKERAIMVRHITKLDIPIPELVAVQTPAISEAVIRDAMGSAMFEDMGDDEARKQGLGWNESGAVEYGRNGMPHA